MKIKKVIMILLVIIVFLIPQFVICAHSGKTDSQGGHFDHSSGEYHYHHGYSAHQHYDMDGDGERDCPYNFKDKTSSHSDSSTSLDLGTVFSNILMFIFDCFLSLLVLGVGYFSALMLAEFLIAMIKMFKKDIPETIGTILYIISFIVCGIIAIIAIVAIFMQSFQ